MNQTPGVSASFSCVQLTVVRPRPVCEFCRRQIRGRVDDARVARPDVSQSICIGFLPLLRSRYPPLSRAAARTGNYGSGTGRYRRGYDVVVELYRGDTW